jgi:hypothetical protein
MARGRRDGWRCAWFLLVAAVSIRFTFCPRSKSGGCGRTLTRGMSSHFCLRPIRNNNSNDNNNDNDDNNNNNDNDINNYTFPVRGLGVLMPSSVLILILV